MGILRCFRASCLLTIVAAESSGARDVELRRHVNASMKEDALLPPRAALVQFHSHGVTHDPAVPSPELPVSDFLRIRPKGWKPPPTTPTTTTTTLPPHLSAEMQRGEKPNESTTMPRYLPQWFLVSLIILCGLLMAVLYHFMPWDTDEYEEDVAEDEAAALAAGESTKSMCRAQSMGRQGSVKEGHEVDWAEYFSLAFWELMLIANASLTRIVCQHGIPEDCQANTNTVDFVKTIHELLIYGMILAIFVGVDHEERFVWLFRFRKRNPRGILFLVIFFAASPVYGMLSEVESLKHFSLTTESSFGAINQIIFAVLIGGAIALSIWHVYFAWATNNKKGFIAYIVSRIVIIGVFVAYFLAASDMSTYVFHLHHYAVGFMFAVIAEFNHPLSLVALAAGAGVMVQGMAAYGADPITHTSSYAGAAQGR